MKKDNKNEMILDVIDRMGNNLIDMRNDRKYEIEKIDEFIKKMTKVYRYVEDTQESLRKAGHLQKKVVLMGCEISNLNDTIKKYQKALELAADSFAHEFSCGAKCPNFRDEVSSGEYGEISPEECKESLVMHWKRLAGIGVIDPARIVKD